MSEYFGLTCYYDMNDFFGKQINQMPYQPASMAQLDAHLTGDQKVVCSTSTELATFFRGD